MWRELVQRKYDPLPESEGMDWKHIFQTRNWAEQVVRHGEIQTILEESADDVTRPQWKLTGEKLAGTIRDMMFENGIINLHVCAN